jgi:hypothetical protein
MDHLIWRPVAEADLIALQEFDSACLQVDGSIRTASGAE